MFGIGLNKTGTTTLKACLERLGYRVKGPDLGLLKCVDRGELDPVFEVADAYDGFQDWPWPLVYEEMDKRYEESKFILTRRESSDVWFESLKKHSIKKGPTEYREIAYGYEMPEGQKEHHVDIYERHNEEVRAYFDGREDALLEVCWEEGDGWEVLCDFLGHEVPAANLPHEKQSPNRLRLELKRIRRYIEDALG